MGGFEKLWAWGDNSVGQPGNRTATSSPTAVRFAFFVSKLIIFTNTKLLDIGDNGLQMDVLSK